MVVEVDGGRARTGRLLEHVVVGDDDTLTAEAGEEAGAAAVPRSDPTHHGGGAALLAVRDQAVVVHRHLAVGVAGLSSDTRTLSSATATSSIGLSI